MPGYEEQTVEITRKSLRLRRQKQERYLDGTFTSERKLENAFKKYFPGEESKQGKEAKEDLAQQVEPLSEEQVIEDIATIHKGYEERTQEIPLPYDKGTYQEQTLTPKPKPLTKKDFIEFDL